MDCRFIYGSKVVVDGLCVVEYSEVSRQGAYSSHYDVLPCDTHFPGCGRKTRIALAGLKAVERSSTGEGRAPGTEGMIPIGALNRHVSGESS